jgi:hypothetical protein
MIIFRSLLTTFEASSDNEAAGAVAKKLVQVQNQTLYSIRAYLDCDKLLENNT